MPLVYGVKIPDQTTPRRVAGDQGVGEGVRRLYLRPEITWGSLDPLFGVRKGELLSDTELGRKLSF